MLDVLKELEQAGSWREMCQELGLFLGLSAPVPGSVLRRARQDDRFAAWLIMCRNQDDLLEALINDSRNMDFSKPEDLEPVSPLVLAGKAGKALLKWAGDSFKSVPPDVLQLRKQSCETCPRLVEAPDFSAYKIRFSREADYRVCSACGCTMSRKIQIPGESCPAKRWAAVDVKTSGEEI
jgi:hypothetical protein